jgi:hypothetical protein
MSDIVRLLTYIWYTRRFGSWVWFRPHVTSYNYTDRFFIILFLVAAVGIEHGTRWILGYHAV